MTNTEIVKKLIGEIQPYGDSSIDKKRFENLKEMCQLIEELVSEIQEASKSKDRYEASMKEIGQYAFNFLTELTQ